MYTDVWKNKINTTIMKGLYIIVSMFKLIKQILKFSIVGFIAFLIDFGLYTIISQVLQWHYIVAGTISFTVSVIFNYLASMKYVFKHKEGMSKTKEFIIFVILSIIGLFINNACLLLLIDLIVWPFYISKPILELGSKIVATAVVMIWNFVSRKILLDDDNNGRK